ncbi:MAG: Heavy-metal resistance protein [Deltaproteobacteria bacterium]|jgi:Spy/CpxP family protein refolding chaperone|nr:Heavy-metal resistance protein [Deltaproteobacteria bacterium]
MTNLRTTLAVCFASLTLLVCPITAQPLSPGLEGGPPGPGGPAFLDNVFPPGLIMRHQSDIGLTDEQRAAITKQMEEAQKELVTLQWEVERESEKLGKLLEGARIDEAAALRQADQVMTAEQRLKKAHLTLLIRVKNDLTPAQQQKLRDLRPERRRGRPH